MKSAFGTVFLAASGLFSLFTSWASMADPVSFGQRLGLAAGGPDGFNEIRAQYGGFFLALAVVNALVLGGALRRQTGYVMNAAVFGGLFFGRLTSLVLNGGFHDFGGTIRALFIIDGTGLALSILSRVWDQRG